MGGLRGPKGADVILPYRALVGRSPLAQLRLESTLVSAEHAVIFFETRDEWSIRDLGSRNGTTVNGQPCAPGTAMRLNLGDRVSFGNPEEQWTLDDTQAPEPCAYSQGGAAPCFGTHGLLLLPNEAAPEASVYPDAQEWVAEWREEVKRVVSGDQLQLASGPWLLLLPPLTASPGTITETAPFALAEVDLRFLVSRDEETVELSLTWRGMTRKIPSHSCLYVLLLLARERIAAAGDAHDGPGWIHSEALATKLGCSREKMNVDIHRIRRVFQHAGVHDAGSIVERSVAQQALRIGTDRLHIDKLDG